MDKIEKALQIYDKMKLYVENTKLPSYYTISNASETSFLLLLNHLYVSWVNSRTFLKQVQSKNPLV